MRFISVYEGITSQDIDGHSTVGVPPPRRNRIFQQRGIVLITSSIKESHMQNDNTPTYTLASMEYALRKTYITEDEVFQHILDVQEGLHKDGIECPDLNVAVSVVRVGGTPDLERIRAIFLSGLIVLIT